MAENVSEVLVRLQSRREWNQIQVPSSDQRMYDLMPDELEALLGEVDRLQEQEPKVMAQATLIGKMNKAIKEAEYGDVIGALLDALGRETELQRQVRACRKIIPTDEGQKFNAGNGMADVIVLMNEWDDAIDALGVEG